MFLFLTVCQGALHPLLSGDLHGFSLSIRLVPCLHAPVHTVVRTLVSGTEQPCLMPTVGELMPLALSHQ